MSALHMGDPDAARPHTLFMIDRAEERTTSRAAAGHGFAVATYLSFLEGDWNASRQYSDRGMERSPANPHLLMLRAVLEHETGDSAQGDIHLEHLLAAADRPGPVLSWAWGMATAAVARITAVPGRLEIAEAAPKTVLSDQGSGRAMAGYAEAGLALLAVQKGDQSTAEEYYAYLLGQRATMILSSVDRLLGLLSQTMGNSDRAAAHFEDAPAFSRKAGYRPELAWICCDYADALHERNGPEDRAKASALLYKSLAISTHLGMRPLMERVSVRLERINARPMPAPASPGGLTEREVEVLRLLATGKTNLEIADELVIAEGTARRHVANIYEKIGAANRVEAASYAAHQGLSQSGFRPRTPAIGSFLLECSPTRSSRGAG